MSQNISKIYCFVSTASQQSKGVVELCVKNKLPVSFVRLDTKESREAASKGETVRILNVPSLVVEYEEGDIQMFQGTHKIVPWLTNNFLRPKVNPNNPNNSSLLPDPSRPNPNLVRQDPDFIELDEVEFQEEEEEEKPIKKKKKDKKKSKKKYQEDILEFDDDEAPSNYYRPEREEEDKTSKSSSQYVNKTPMKDIKAMAAQMEEERKNLFPEDKKKSGYY